MIETSKDIEKFLELVKNNLECHRLNYEQVGIEDKRTTDFLHSIEFSKEKDLGKVALDFHNSREARRIAKNYVLGTTAIFKLDQELDGKLVQLLERALEMQKNAESYLNGAKEYKSRS